MSSGPPIDIGIPKAQQVIRAKCFHPTGRFVPFTMEAIEQSIPARFEQQVRRHANRLAVKTRDQALTYAELNEAANRLAHAILARRGEGQEPIALLFAKGVPLIVAILGVLKAGKIYMPVDPSLPRGRMTYMLDESQTGLIVADNETFSLTDGLDQNGQQLINMDELSSGLSTEDPDLSLSSDALAYLVYTSGSTGQPKGVVDNHRNVLHVSMTQTNEFHICAHDRLTYLGSRGGDIYRALLNGAALYPVDIKQEGLAHLAHWLIQEEITIYNSVVSAFRHLCDTLTGDEQFPKLRLLKLIGEPVYGGDVELYKKFFSPDCIFVNSLGTAEGGHLRHYLIDKDTQITGSLVPVGYAVEGSEILILDHDGQEVGYNQIGEITVKSRFLSPGYWRRPDLTQASFLADLGGGGERIYRTGDLGCMLPDGCLVHLGRKDFQVKIRGNRVEVAETETALLALDAVKEAVVVVQEEIPGDARLVAYIVPTSEPAPSISTLRRALAEKLPDYMIPSAFVMMDALPLIGIGKVDRQALPAPGRARPNLPNPIVAPRTPCERELMRIWSGVLKLEEVGIYDNFLELGGDSLLATRIVSRVQDSLQVDVSLRSLMEAPTIADMAVVIAQSQAENAPRDEVDRLLMELEGLSDEASQRLLAEEDGKHGRQA
jgi:amino acid adenylation domain-containing protein